MCPTMFTQLLPRAGLSAKLWGQYWMDSVSPYSNILFYKKVKDDFFLSFAITTYMTPGNL